MKIAINTRFLLKDGLEGVGWVSYELLQRIVRDHPDDEFIFIFDRPFHDSFIFGPNVRPVVIGPQARHPILWYYWFEWSLPKLLQREKPDLFFSLDGYCSLRTKVPTSLMIHDIAHQHFPEQVPLVSRYYYHHFVPQFLRRAEQVLTVSHFTKTDIVRRYAIPEEKITVVHNGSREGFRALETLEQEAVKSQYANGQDYFFYIGAVHPRKNIHRLIEAFDRYKSETGANTQLLIGGRFAWQTGVIKSTYEKAKYRAEIKLLGYLEEEELFRLMGAAKAFVYLSVFEGFGLPVLEAFHAEVPVITTNRSSLPEVAGQAALLVENPEDVAEITQALKKVSTDLEFRQTLVAEGRKQRKQFSWEKAAQAVYQQLESLYQQSR